MSETIFVLGLGETLKYFNIFGSDTIGVNDIYSQVPTKYVVCVDKPHKFIPSRMKTICECKPQEFITQLPEWKNHRSITLIKDPFLRAGGKFKNNEIYYSLCSPFVACSIAHTMGYKNIVMYGVDFNTHPKLKPHVGTMIRDFIWLKDNGVNLFVGHKASKLSEFLPVWSYKTYPESQQLKQV